MIYETKYQTKIGWLHIKGNNIAITQVMFTDKEPSLESDNLPTIYKELLNQLDDYFLHQKWTFDIPLQLKGTDFQQKVWKELEKIPFGKTRSYLNVAKKLGDEKKIRAAANANAKNPIAILIPCHRVIGSNNSLTGYAGGLFRKKFLLELEQGVESLQLF